MLLLQLFEKMSLIALAAFIFSQTRMFNNLIKDKVELRDKFIMILFFSAVAIIGTYMGIDVGPHAYANTRPIAVITAGYIGGPVVGLIVGAVAGLHRYSLGGFTAFSCGVASIFEALAGVAVRKYSKGNKFNILGAFSAGLIGEIFQIIIILIFARPLQNAIELEKVIALPMIFVNTIGVMVFVKIIENVREDYNRRTMVVAHEILTIAKKTLEHMKKGFNKSTAENVAEIIFNYSNIRGVFLGDEKGFLAYKGRTLDEEALKREVEKYYNCPVGNMFTVINGKRECVFLCTPIITSDDQFKGVLGLKFNSKRELDDSSIELSKELSNLLASQIELYNLNNLAQEAYAAEVKALRSQIHPHFLFNALNTIASFCRTNPTKARELIIDLSNFFRTTLKREEDFVPLKDEIALIESYMSIEKARFGERVSLQLEINKNLHELKVPVFVLQPLVENCIKHGLSPKVEGGSIFVRTYDELSKVKFMVEDTGCGIAEEKCRDILQKGNGIGLKNINERLKLIYGNEYGLTIKSKLNQGTIVEFCIPKEEV
ncbi:LytS/YhcK type 5TM receptor domain-containing protein [Clostridium omnivorum]|uniref:histidine kinase n=1 Tax=Clostridium omnivorum TaxID=1604902 RepID=A0ABQ5N6E8_9CLOT|nr:LytS/YhcK type 5TM receptor domain-containing protein [Clostridium sp. E14]GLC30595.1 sensor histidine kinase [Clostridium sp. E14]